MYSSSMQYDGCCAAIRLLVMWGYTEWRLPARPVLLTQLDKGSLLTDHAGIKVHTWTLLQEYVGRRGCWGYEDSCPQNDSYSTPHCPGDHRGWVPSKKDQVNTFYTQGDFGYVAEQQKELMVICEPNFAVSWIFYKNK